MKKFFLNWGPVLLLGALIYFQSAFPSPVSIPFPLDKILHFLEFALLGFFTLRAVLLTWNLGQKAALLLAGSLAGLWGLLDEWHQSFVPLRQASWGDALADIAGAFAGAFLFLWVGKVLFRQKILYDSSGCPMTDSCSGNSRSYGA